MGIEVTSGNRSNLGKKIAAMFDYFAIYMKDLNGN